VLIPALGNDWNGLLTKRFIGQADATDFDRIEALLELMKDKKGTERAILWNEAIALANDGVLLFSVQVEGDQGEIQETYNPEQYQPGIWQCTVTRYPQFDGKKVTYRKPFDPGEESYLYLVEIKTVQEKAAVKRRPFCE